MAHYPKIESIGMIGSIIMAILEVQVGLYCTSSPEIQLPGERSPKEGEAPLAKVPETPTGAGRLWNHTPNHISHRAWAGGAKATR